MVATKPFFERQRNRACAFVEVGVVAALIHSPVSGIPVDRTGEPADRPAA